MNQKPRHIAIIMDGNGRWAQERNLPRNKGHEKGVESVQRVIEACLDFSIPYLTLYAFSTENWNRPKDEVEKLMHFLSHYLDDKRKMLHDNGIRFNAIGRVRDLSEAIQKKIERNMTETMNYTRMTFTLALSYSGRTDIVSAMNAILRDRMAGKLTADTVTEEMIQQYLSTRTLPYPDLLIRTSNEQRISNFMLWESAYTEFYFTKVYWPDFSKEHLREALNEYERRDRRFGTIS